MLVNPLPDDNVLTLSQLRAFADDKIKYYLTLYQTIPGLHGLLKKAFKNIVENGENAGNQHFLLFPQSFFPYLRQKSPLKQ